MDVYLTKILKFFKMEDNNQAYAEMIEETLDAIEVDAEEVADYLTNVLRCPDLPTDKLWSEMSRDEQVAWIAENRGDADLIYALDEFILSRECIMIPRCDSVVRANLKIIYDRSDINGGDLLIGKRRVEVPQLGADQIRRLILNHCNVVDLASISYEVPGLNCHELYNFTFTNQVLEKVWCDFVSDRFSYIYYSAPMVGRARSILSSLKHQQRTGGNLIPVYERMMNYMYDLLRLNATQRDLVILSMMGTGFMEELSRVYNCMTVRGKRAMVHGSGEYLGFADIGSTYANLLYVASLLSFGFVVVFLLSCFALLVSPTPVWIYLIELRAAYSMRRSGVYGGGLRPKGGPRKPGGKPRAGTKNNFTKRRVVEYKDYLTEDMRKEMLYQRCSRIENDSSIGATGLSFVTEDPKFLCRNERVKVVYTVLNLKNELIEVPQGRNTCLLDGLLTAYIGTRSSKDYTMDDYLEDVGYFNRKIIELCERHNYLMDNKFAGSSALDWADLNNWRRDVTVSSSPPIHSEFATKLCNKLDIKVLLVSKGVLKSDIDPILDIDGGYRLDEHGSVMRVKGKTFHGYAALLHWQGLPDGSDGHFSLVTNVRVGPGFDPARNVHGSFVFTEPVEGSGPRVLRGAMFADFLFNIPRLGITPFANRKHTVKSFVMAFNQYKFDINLPKNPYVFKKETVKKTRLAPEVVIDEKKLPEMPKLSINIRYFEASSYSNIRVGYNDEDSYASVLREFNNLTKKKGLFYLVSDDGTVVLNPHTVFRFKNVHNGTSWFARPFTGDMFVKIVSSDKMRFRFSDSKGSWDWDRAVSKQSVVEFCEKWIKENRYKDFVPVVFTFGGKEFDHTKTPCHKLGNDKYILLQSNPLEDTTYDEPDSASSTTSTESEEESSTSTVVPEESSTTTEHAPEDSESSSTTHTGTGSDSIDHDDDPSDGSSDDSDPVIVPPHPPAVPKVRGAKYFGLSGMCHWNVKYPKILLTNVDAEASPVVGFFAEVFGGSISRCIWESKLARKFMDIRYRSKVLFPKLRAKLSLFQKALMSDQGYQYLAAISMCYRESVGDFSVSHNPLYFETYMGSSMNLRQTRDEFSWTFFKKVAAFDVHDYARAVTQSHEDNLLFQGKMVVTKEFDYEDDSSFFRFMNGLTLDTERHPLDFPRLRGDGRLEKVKLPFNKLTDVEKILFLSCMYTGYERQRSDFLFDMTLCSELTSPKVLGGCDSIVSVEQRIHTVASSTCAKFNFNKMAKYAGADLFENSIIAARCIASSMVEKRTHIQPIDDLPDDRLSACDNLPVSRKRLSVYGSNVNYISKNIAGYRTVEDRDMAPPGSVVRNFKYTIHPDVIAGKREQQQSDFTKRKAVGITSYNVQGNCAPIPDIGDSDNIKEGLAKRIGTAVPEPNHQTKVMLPLYVQEWIKSRELNGAIIELLVETVDEMLDWDKYEKTLRYSPFRLRMLRKIRKEVAEIETFDFADTDEGKLMSYLWTKIEMHVKWESYHGEKKYVRGIFARMDHFKVFYGGFSKLIQRVMYKKLDSMVTDMPVSDLARYLIARLTIYPLILCGDFSAFESHNYPWLMWNVSLRVIVEIFSTTLTQEQVVGFECLVGKNVIENYFQSCTVHGKLMSGETLTTIINSITNEVMLCYICEAEGLVYGIGFFVNPHRRAFAFVGRILPDNNIVMTIFVVGDDSVMGLPLLPHVDYTKYYKTDYLKRYGVNLKLTLKDSVSGSGFLSKIFSELDYLALCDPLKQLSKGVLPMKYAHAKVGLKKGLSRCRAISLLYEFGGCPVVSAYAECVIRCTRNISVTRALAMFEIDDPYNHDRMVKAMEWYDDYKAKFGYSENPVSIESRFLVEDNFGIPVCTQIYMEQYFHGINDTNYPIEFKVPCMDLVTPEANADFYETYLVDRVLHDTCTLTDEVLLNYSRERPPHALVHVETDWFDMISRDVLVCV